jgi:hypothetical protein
MKETSRTCRETSQLSAMLSSHRFSKEYVAGSCPNPSRGRLCVSDKTMELTRGVNNKWFTVQSLRSFVASQVLTAASVFWDAAPCSLAETDHWFRVIVLLMEAVSTSETSVNSCEIHGATSRNTIIFICTVSVKMVLLYSRLSYLVMLYQFNRLFCVELIERILMHDEMEIERTGETK